jgi:hypothetical protein
MEHTAVEENGRAGQDDQNGKSGRATESRAGEKQQRNQDLVGAKTYKATMESKILCRDPGSTQTKQSGSRGYRTRPDRDFDPMGA